MIQDSAHYADVFAALGSEPRLDIMRLLFAAYPKGMTVGELQSQLEIPSSTLSHHLEKLRVEELVTVQRDRQFLWYCVNVEAIEALLTFLYNGCSVRDSVVHAEQSYADLEQNTDDSPIQEGFMFVNIFQSVQTFFRELRLALPGFERLTQKAIQSISLAQNETRRLQHQYVGTEQLLVGLLTEGTGIAAQVLTEAGVQIDLVKTAIEEHIGRGNGTPIQLPFTPRAKKVLDISLKQARQLNHSYIGTEHLLLGLLIEGKGLGVKVLKELGFNCKTLEQQLRSAMESDS
jgi:ArsR family transcriptional regulator, arsenate/arsenite/antimonite-responsive transcriptional repressor / arsenate reductase (thioredoxin)